MGKDWEKFCHVDGNPPFLCLFLELGKILGGMFLKLRDASRQESTELKG
jgi:hypothetical protein